MSLHSAKATMGRGNKRQDTNLAQSPAGVFYVAFSSVSAGTATSWSSWWLQGKRAPVCTAWLGAQPSPCLLSRGGTQEYSPGFSLTAVQKGKLFVQSKLTNSP